MFSKSLSFIKNIYQHWEENLKTTKSYFHHSSWCYIFIIKIVNKFDCVGHSSEESSIHYYTDRCAIFTLTFKKSLTPDNIFFNSYFKNGDISL